MQFTSVRCMAQHLEMAGKFTFRINANINSYSFALLSAYETPKELQDPTTILAGTTNFSPDDWEVFYLG